MKSWRNFVWLHWPKYDKESTQHATKLAKKRLDGMFGELTPKQVKELSACLSLITEINQSNTIRLLKEYNEWLSNQKQN